MPGPEVREQDGPGPLVSVTISFYNNESTLHDAVASVLGQTFTDFELLLVDDGSDDASLAVAASFADHRIRVISDGCQRGFVGRLNQMTSEASGTYLARMDGDDLCHPDRLARQVAFLREHPEVDLVATGAWVIDEHHRVVGARHAAPLPAEHRDTLAPLLLQPTVMGRRSWFAAHPYDPAFPRAEDRELWCRAWRPGSFSRIPEKLFFYREAGRLRPASYQTGCRSSRRITRRYGPELVGRWGTLQRLGVSMAIEAVTVAAAWAGLERGIIRLRSQPLAEVERREGQALLDRIRAA